MTTLLHFMGFPKFSAASKTNGNINVVVRVIDELFLLLIAGV
jgi:hypothetical protein